MTNEEAIRIIGGDVLGTTEQTHEAVVMAIEALRTRNVPDKNVGDMISRQAAIDAIKTSRYLVDAMEKIIRLPSAEPEYEPVKAEDFARTMSENTLYSFMAWHGEALELMERQGFVICKKMM